MNSLMNRIVKLIFVTLALGCVLTTNAQETETKRSWQPEWGVGLWSEVQTVAPSSADEDWRFNSANLLRWNVGLPVSRGWSFKVAALSACMTADESLGREHQTFSNLDAGMVPFALSVGGLQWENSSMNANKNGSSSHNLHSIFLGVRNMNEDYFASPVTGFFVNSTWGILPTLSCNMDMANYPNASVGMHYRYERKVGGKAVQNLGSEAAQNPKPQPSIVFQASLYNGTGYSHLWGRENVFRVCPKSDGVFGLMDVEYHRGESSYFVGTGIRGQKGQGVSAAPWIYAEQHIVRGLSLIATYSHAFGKEIDCRDIAGIGAHYALPKVELGVFADYARFADSNSLHSGYMNEWATELSCKVNIVPHISLHPALHLIASNGFQAAGTVRLGVEF